VQERFNLLDMASAPGCPTISLSCSAANGISDAAAIRRL
jgi:hypothetical protein